MRLHFWLIASVIAISQIGCSGGPPTLGDQMIQEAQQTEQLGKSWNEGQRLLERGRDLQAKAAKLAKESQQTLSEAEAMIAEGKSLMAGSEETIQANLDVLNR